MKGKILNAALLLTSLIGYLEWGKDNHTFLFQAEWEIISKLFSAPSSVIHPLTLLPLIGQIVLIFTLFQKQVNKSLTIIGLSSIGVLLLLMFVIGIMSANFKILLSTIPFLFTSIITLMHHQKKKMDIIG